MAFCYLSPFLSHFHLSFYLFLLRLQRIFHNYFETFWFVLQRRQSPAWLRAGAAGDPATPHCLALQREALVKYFCGQRAEWVPWEQLPFLWCLVDLAVEHPLIHRLGREPGCIQSRSRLSQFDSGTNPFSDVFHNSSWAFSCPMERLGPSSTCQRWGETLAQHFLVPSPISAPSWARAGTTVLQPSTLTVVVQVEKQPTGEMHLNFCCSRTAVWHREICSLSAPDAVSGSALLRRTSSGGQGVAVQCCLLLEGKYLPNLHWLHGPTSLNSESDEERSEMQRWVLLSLGGRHICLLYSPEMAIAKGLVLG